MKNFALLAAVSLCSVAICLAYENTADSFDLNGLTRMSDAQTRSISAENPTGELGNGAKAVPDANSSASELGKGWKARSRIGIRPGQTETIAEIKEPGVIRHIWITTSDKAYRDIVLRFYWDGEKEPSVEVPLGDFFANGHEERYAVNSMPVAVNPTGGFNCYWAMPFKKSCKITIENQGAVYHKYFYYQITYTMEKVPADSVYFHAQWRRSTSRDDKNPEHIILDGIKGRGHYVGTFIDWGQITDPNVWWGDGEIKFFIDGDKEYPTICGTGTEDYVGGAWCFKGTYSTMFLGYPHNTERGKPVVYHSLYRWHIPDPIYFRKDLRISIQALGWFPTHKYRPLVNDDICSVAYWYQTEPHNSFPKLPAAALRKPVKYQQ